MPAVRLTFARFDEEDGADWLASALRMLSPSERERAAAISDAGARTRHAVGRALIRLIGAEAGGQDPRRLPVTVTDAGKPRLPGPAAVEVSVAHCERLVVTADCRSVAVGVDVEPIPPAVDRTSSDWAPRLARRLFSSAEVATLRALSARDAANWFTGAWTIKEAVGKALGVGLVPALGGAIVEGGPGELVLAQTPGGPPAHTWTVHQLLAPGGDERVAVALPARGVRLECVRVLRPESFADACTPGATR